MRVPVVLPVVGVEVAAHGRLTITVDGTPYEPGSVFTRRNLRDVLAQITTTLDSPVRVEVREADGTTYVDFATPPEQTTGSPEEATPEESRPGGFQPGEEVALAYILTRSTADTHGNAPLPLPPALMASRREGLVLVGLTSHTIATIQ